MELLGPDRESAHLEYKSTLRTHVGSGEEYDQMAAAEDVTIKYLDSSDLQALVLQAYAPLIQGKAKVAHQEHCPIVPLETAVLKTVAAFLNSRDGGTLLIGVADDGTVQGLDTDDATLHKPGTADRDRFQQHLANIITSSMGPAAATNVRPVIQHVDGGDVCRVQVDPCGFLVDATVIHDKNGQHVKETQFFVRIANGTKPLDDAEKAKYVAHRWPT